MPRIFTSPNTMPEKPNASKEPAAATAGILILPWTFLKPHPMARNYEGLPMLRDMMPKEATLPMEN